METQVIWGSLCIFISAWGKVKAIFDPSLSYIWRQLNKGSNKPL